MSAQTKGRVEISTRDTWTARTAIVGHSGGHLFIELAGEKETRIANRRRIVALWNAAEELGLTTEQIEGGAIQDAFDDSAAIEELAGQAAWADATDAAIRSLTKEGSK